MNHRAAINCMRNPLLATLLLLAFAGHALVPSGFMPGRGGLVICHGTGAASADTRGHDGADPQHPGANLCPFAAAATTMATATSAQLPALATPVVSAIDLPLRSFIPRGTIVPTRLPRGPPAIA